MYYKVVDTDLKSAAAHYPACIQYKIGEWVKPNISGSRLFVFNDLEAAKTFSTFRSCYVYECDVQDIDLEMRTCSKYISGQDIYYFWSEKYMDNVEQASLIENTVLVGQVKLLQKIPCV